MQKHPLTSNQSFTSLGRYIIFHIKAWILGEYIYSWLGGLKFYVRKGDAGLVGNIYYGLYEFEDSIFLLHFVRPTDFFMDLGANLGHFSLLLSGIKNCQTLAIEPVPSTYKRLLRNVELNNLENRISCLQIGVGENFGNLFFSTDRNTMDRIVHETYSPSVEVRVKPIDTLVPPIPAVIKIDVEGFEYFALMGARQTLANDSLKVILIELNGSGNKYGICDEKTVNALNDFGFRPYRYDYINRKLIALENYNTLQFNTLFVKDASFVGKRLMAAEKIKINNHWV